MYSDYVNDCKNALKRQLSYVTYTQQTRELNIGFLSLELKNVNKSLAVVWHERISGGNDEDITSALLKPMNSVEFRDWAKLRDVAR